jgi:hypothetical protein
VQQLRRDFGDVAQLGERGLCKPEVVGSIPIISTSYAVEIADRNGRNAAALNVFFFDDYKSSPIFDS